MSDYLATVAYFTRIVDSGDYYVIEYFDDRFVVRKRSVEHDLMNVMRRVPCPYSLVLLRVLSLRIRFDKNTVLRSMRC